MKKIILLVVTAAMVLSVHLGLYAQVGEEMGAASGPLLNSRTHPLLLDQATPQNTAFLKSINGENDSYKDTAINKMGAGVINTATAWTDIPRRMVKLSREENLFAGVVVGFGEGLVQGAARGASGIIDVATCGLPPYDEPLMQPKYKVKNPEKEFSVDLMNW